MNTKRRKPIRKTRVLFILAHISLPIISWLVFYIYANISSFGMAFTDRNGVFSFENFIRFFNEFSLPTSQIRMALKNTLLTFAIILVAYPFRVLVSFFIYKKVPFASIYRVLFFLPSIIFSVAIAMVFTRMVSPTGLIAELVQNIAGMEDVPELLADSRFANTTVILHMLWLGFPGDLIIWGGTFARIPDDVLEAGRMDGVSWWTEFTKIIVPMVWPTISLQMVLMFCGIFGASGAVFLLTQGQYGTITIPAWMYLQLYTNSGSVFSSNAYNYLSAVGMVITILAVTISLLIRKFADNFFEEVEF